jgi:hypothetical protein
MSKKYNRTLHLPWSLGTTIDDKVAKSAAHFINKQIIITEKCDGSNSSLESDGCFARTHAGPPTHPSFDYLKAFHSSIKDKIPEGFQLFGENCFAVHSIEYTELPYYFLLFGVRDQDNSIWASWDEVELWSTEIGVPTVPVLFKGLVSSENELKIITTSLMNSKSQLGGELEGLVIRLADSFSDDNFSFSVAKMVRPNHVQTSEHWSHQQLKKNSLK